jgi:hypothetical protein
MSGATPLLALTRRRICGSLQAHSIIYAQVLFWKTDSGDNVDVNQVAIKSSFAAPARMRAFAQRNSPTEHRAAITDAGA